MPLLNDTSKRPKPPTNAPKDPDEPRVSETGYDDNITDTRYQDRRHLVTEVEGSPWWVDYYQQVIGNDNELSPLQLDKPAVYQQYIKIHDFELRVTQPLDPQQQQGSNKFDVTGTANVYPPLIPNKGDMLVGEVSDGRKALLTVTESRRQSIFKDTTYQVDYRLISYLTPEYSDNLKAKTVKERHFVKSLLEQGSSPFVSTETLAQQRGAIDATEQLLDFYLSTFYDFQSATLLVPCQHSSTYDPHVTAFIQGLYDTDYHPLMRKLRAYTTQLPGRTAPFSAYDALLTGRFEMLRHCHYYMNILRAKRFGRFAQYDGVYFSGVDYVVYPTKNATDPDAARLLTPVPPMTCFGFTLQPDEDEPDDPSDRHVDYPPIGHYRTHIFSQALYNDSSEGLTTIEALVRQRLKGRTTSAQALLGLGQQCWNWPALAQFYYIPVILWLMSYPLD